MKTEPHAESERLRAYYAQLSDGELNEIGSQYDSLTKQAQSALRAEFDRRELPAPELADDGHEYQHLVTVRQYRDPFEASIAKSVLDSAGIFSFLKDENTVRLDWGYSQAIGGIRLQVRPEDLEAAEAVLAQPIPPVIKSDSGDYEQPRCPSCQSLDIGRLLAAPTGPATFAGLSGKNSPTTTSTHRNCESYMLYR